ncbi:hypothetical protein TrVE_jg8970 [Triparma verrucosa]|uniref:MFS general substrate transporter n=1 Tax=Triparma verrucosa TaxID=1606542 RepID=A0A9W6ZD10_9STRA|nr:hypothetical protein TrVE_jg8970 [Triparma verrucosa]
MSIESSPLLPSPLPPPTPLLPRLLTLLTFTLHNSFNCWFFLNFTNFPPAQSLLSLTEQQVGSITTAGWLGILSTLPLVTLCTYHRTLLFLSGLLNILPPFLRYYTSLNQTSSTYTLICLSNFLAGSSFGIIGAWPAMLAQQWGEGERAGITAAASLANYAGGAVAVVFVPVLAGDGEGLLRMFEYQTWAAGVLFVGMGTWFWIPPLEVDEGVSVRVAVKVSMRKWRRLGCSGLIVGLTLLLQGMNQFILSSFGYTSTQAGIANCIYQATSAIVGVLVSLKIKDASGVRTTLRRMIFWGGLGYVLFAVFASIINEKTDEDVSGSLFDVVLVYFFMAVLGSTLMGALPLILLSCINIVNEDSSYSVSENVVSGLVYIEAMSLAAGMTYVTTEEEGMVNVLVVGVLLGVGILGMFWEDRNERKEKEKEAKGVI